MERHKLSKFLKISQSRWSMYRRDMKHNNIKKTFWKMPMQNYKFNTIVRKGSLKRSPCK